MIIDVNPRLVEPANAFFSGVDLLGAMLELAVGGEPDVRPTGRPECSAIRACCWRSSGRRADRIAPRGSQ